MQVHWGSFWLGVGATLGAVLLALGGAVLVSAVHAFIVTVRDRQRALLGPDGIDRSQFPPPPPPPPVPPASQDTGTRLTERGPRGSRRVH